MDSCDGCTTFKMYLMPLSYTLKNAKMANFMLCKSCHGKKEWQTNYSSYGVENRCRVSWEWGEWEEAEDQQWAWGFCHMVLLR